MVCIECSTAYRVPTDESWKVRCFRCWKQWKHQQQQHQQQHQHQQHQGTGPDDVTVQRLRATLCTLQIENERLRQQLARRSPALPALDAHRWRSFAQFIHPDRHGNSPVATEIMQFLNQLRPH
jgi:hypothetical protein